MTNLIGNAMKYTYDDLDRVSTVTDPLKQVTTYYVYGLGWNVLEEFQTAVNSQPLNREVAYPMV